MNKRGDGSAEAQCYDFAQEAKDKEITERDLDSRYNSNGEPEDEVQILSR